MKYIILILFLMLSCLPGGFITNSHNQNTQNNGGASGADVNLSNFYTKSEIDKFFLELSNTTTNKFTNYPTKDEIDKLHPYRFVNTQRSYSYNFDNELTTCSIQYYNKNGFPYKYETYIKNPDTQKFQLCNYTEYIHCQNSNLVKEYHHYQDIDFDEIFKHHYSKNTYTFR